MYEKKASGENKGAPGHGFQPGIPYFCDLGKRYWRMIADEYGLRIREAFPFEPTGDQSRAMDTFCGFLADRDSRAVMVMRGSAGTGKTALASAMVRAVLSLGRRVMLLAPTGRAAKVFSLSASYPAYTVHRRIYRQKSLTADGGRFVLGENMFPGTLFMVDEASMVSNRGSADALFASGRLLEDLLDFVYGGRGCRLVLIGDRAQLPPVGEGESPALSPEVLEGYGMKVHLADLDEVLRQAAASGILFNATAIRRMATRDAETMMPRVTLSGFADICVVRGRDIVELIDGSYSRVGVDETIVVTRSNKWANRYNAGIRSMVFSREEELTSGDLLMVARNNYHWLERLRDGAPGEAAGGDGADMADARMMSFIANGDRAMVRRVRNLHEYGGLHFADAMLEFPDYDGAELTATVVMDSLMAEAPALTREQGERLFNAVMQDCMDIPTKAARMARLRQDPHYNALQVKYAYAVTCHKAQGGQWAHVYLDQGYMTEGMMGPEYVHWLYTAFTRATERLFLVNWPRRQADGQEDA